MKEQELLKDVKAFGWELVWPVSSGAKVAVKLLRERQPCRVEVRVKAAPTKRADVLARVRDARELQEAWQKSFEAGHMLQVSPRKTRLDGEEIVFECNLLTLEVSDG